MRHFLPGLLIFTSVLFTATAQTKKKTAVKKKATTTPAAVVPKPAAGPSPLAFDTMNPRVFRLRGRTTLLLGSAERFSAVENTGTDIRKYLDAVAEDHLNLVRVVNGTYVEAAELPTYLAPWVRKADGTYDVSQFEPRYFERLKLLVSEAGLRNIVVDVMLFSTQYGSGKGYGAWAQNPLNTGKLNWDRFNTLEDAALVGVQEALLQKTVTELNAFDNLYFTVCNECKYSGATAKDTDAWVSHMVAAVRATEAKLPNKHLISDLSPTAFHSSGLLATTCNPTERRKDAWPWFFSGGAAFSAGAQPCKESSVQFGVLMSYLRQFDFVGLKPDANAVRQWPLGASEAWTLSDPGHAYAVYLRSSGVETKQSVMLMDLPAGKWQIEWWNPRTGDQEKAEPVNHKGGSLRILTPSYSDDIAMRLTLEAK